MSPAAIWDSLVSFGFSEGWLGALTLTAPYLELVGKGQSLVLNRFNDRLFADVFVDSSDDLTILVEDVIMTGCTKLPDRIIIHLEDETGRKINFEIISANQYSIKEN